MRDPLTLVALALVAVSPFLGASAQAYETYCLPQSQLILGGIALGDTSVAVRRLLGRPLQERQDSSEDDGGVYPVVHLRYKDLLVELGREQVEFLTTASPNVSLPSGIRVGMTIQEVGRRLRLPHPASYLRGDTLAPISCFEGPHNPDRAGLDLIFSPAKSDNPRRLVSIHLSEFGP